MKPAVLRGGGREQRRRRATGGVRLAAVGEKRQDILALLARGVGDGHQPLGKQIASIALRPEAALAPQDESRLILPVFNSPPRAFTTRGIPRSTRRSRFSTESPVEVRRYASASWETKAAW